MLDQYPESNKLTHIDNIFTIFFNLKDFLNHLLR